MPTGRDGLLVCDMLRKLEIDAYPCTSLDDFKENIQLGTGAVLIAEEALHYGAEQYLAEMSESEPVWSDIPIVLFAGNSKNAENLLATIGSRFNATIVERPIRITMLISAVRGALRARERQYQTRDLLTELEKADEQKDLFLATLSHELRTPLNSILGWIQMMRSNSEEKVDVGHAIDVIERNARIQSELIADILFISRVVTGKLELNTRPLSTSAVVDSAIDVVRPSAAEKNIEIDFVADDDSIDISGDFERLQQVFWNLLSNAVKFTPDNGSIRVAVRHDSGRVIAEITDSGMGMDAEFLPHVFDRFRQADNSYSRVVGGLGLGLAIVRHLVEMHGGRVSAKSEGLGSGSTFIVSIPVIAAGSVKAAPAAQPLEKADLSELGRNARILLVEDDADSREMLALNFSFSNFEVVTAESAADALTALKSFTPDVIVSDVGLPDEDGYSLMKKIRALPDKNVNAIPAIALTGYVSVQDQATAHEAGYQEHLSKPVDIDELTRLISKLLKG